jgi:hypothetical protein
MIAALLVLLLVYLAWVIISLKRKLRRRFCRPQVERDGTGRRIHERLWR